MWDLSSSVRGSNLCPQCWEGRVQSSTGLPGKVPQDLVRCMTLNWIYYNIAIQRNSMWSLKWYIERKQIKTNTVWFHLYKVQKYLWHSLQGAVNRRGHRGTWPMDHQGSPLIIFYWKFPGWKNISSLAFYDTICSCFLLSSLSFSGSGHRYFQASRSQISSSLPLLQPTGWSLLRTWPHLTLLSCWIPCLYLQPELAFWVPDLKNLSFSGQYFWMSH